LSEDELAQQGDAMSRLSVRLLADNIDTYEQFELRKKHKFEMSQGHFFCTPRNTGADVPVNRMTAVRLLSKLQDPALSLDEFEQTIRTDFTLSYKLLRFSNPAFIGLNRTVESISHAAKLVGMERICL
jgi:EAL and modified HD-GYP domain-containing signal transduction protein